MRFYNTSHQYYCGIDLHTKMMYVCILDNEGEICLHQNIPTQPSRFLKLIAPYREDLVVGVECIFSWYWLADLCQSEEISFILGHALYMKAIHGGKSKNDKIDSEKIAKLIRGGTFPLAHVYPQEMRATRNLLRRRNCLIRHPWALACAYLIAPCSMLPPAPTPCPGSSPLRVPTLSVSSSYLDQEPLGLPGFLNVSLPAWHGLMTPPDLHNLRLRGCFCVAFGVR